MLTSFPTTTTSSSSSSSTANPNENLSNNKRLKYRSTSTHNLSSQIHLQLRSSSSSFSSPSPSSTTTTANQIYHQKNNKKLKSRLISSDPPSNNNHNRLSKSTHPISTSNHHPSRRNHRSIKSSSTLAQRQSRITGPPTNHSESAIDTLRKLIQARWDPITKLLDLANLTQDKILKAARIPAPGQKNAPQKTAGAIWMLCKEICPNLRSISLADNHLQSLKPMSMNILADTFPNLVNLSLAGNRLSSFSDLNSICPATLDGVKKPGFTQLRELILTGNPVRLNAEKDGPVGLQAYLFEVCRRFPTVEILDGETVDPQIKANISMVTNLNPSSSSSLTRLDAKQQPSSSIPQQPQPPLPLPIQSAFFNDPSTSTFVAGFCLQFFHAFDQDRNSLIDVYATKSSFSLCASTSIPSRAKKAGLTRNQPQMPAQQVPSWNEYISISRNNARLKGPKLCERLANGPAEIIEHLKSIPRTKHSLDSPENQHKFIVDSWQMPGLVNESTSHNGAVIYLTIHGEFQEFPSMTIRSFDRTFILGAAGPASAAALKGWPCVILTDQLTVRGYSCPSAWSTTSVNGPQTTSSSLTKHEPTAEEKNELVKQLMEITKLNMDLSVECLAQNGWELARSVSNFNELVARGSLPPNAFLNS